MAVTAACKAPIEDARLATLASTFKLLAETPGAGMSHDVSCGRASRGCRLYPRDAARRQAPSTAPRGMRPAARDRSSGREPRPVLPARPLARRYRADTRAPAVRVPRRASVSRPRQAALGRPAGRSGRQTLPASAGMRVSTRSAGASWIRVVDDRRRPGSVPEAGSSGRGGRTPRAWHRTRLVSIPARTRLAQAPRQARARLERDAGLRPRPSQCVLPASAARNASAMRTSEGAPGRGANRTRPAPCRPR